jgi:hypothetical protein
LLAFQLSLVEGLKCEPLKGYEVLGSAQELAQAVFQKALETKNLRD